MRLTVNGIEYDGDPEPRTSLADFLRHELRLTATKLGCEHGVCGACTVLLGGEPVRSCLLLAVQARDREVTTLEGLADDELRTAFHEQHALQCGFCTAGMLMTAHAFLRGLDGREPAEAEIREAIAGSLCRCTGYDGIVKAVGRAARVAARP